MEQIYYIEFSELLHIGFSAQQFPGKWDNFGRTKIVAAAANSFVTSPKTF